MAKSDGLSLDEIKQAFSSKEQNDQFPPILNFKQVQKMLCGYAASTLRLRITQGYFDGCYRKSGKHLLFWRDRVIARVMNGPAGAQNVSRKRAKAAKPAKAESNSDR